MIESLKILWSTKLEIRVLLVSSLALQILLFSLSGFRKRVISTRWAKESKLTWRGPLANMFHWFLWIAYLLADYVATVALAYLRVGENINDRHLLIFWAPFFLVHLGGQDTITALSVEDNELWARHLITLLTQVVLAGFNYFTINLKYVQFWPPAAIMFVVGLIKYGERVWALQRASMSALRSSMITKPDPGPNYAKFMQEYTSSIQAGLKARITIEEERHKRDDKKERTEDGDKNESTHNRDGKNERTKKDDEKIESTHNHDGKNEITEEDDKKSESTKQSAQKEKDQESKKIKKEEKKKKMMKYSEIVCKAYEFFPRFNRLFVDLILSYKDREESQKHFSEIKIANEAYKLIEIELSWMYEILHSKASVIYTIKYYGWISRVVTLVLTVIALILFHVLVDHKIYQPLNVALTYVLLGAALFLETLALSFMFFSFWTYAVMKTSKIWVFEHVAEFLFPIQQWFHKEKNSRWSQKMAQFSLINYSLLDEPSWWKWPMRKLGLKQNWDHYRYTTFVDVSQELKNLVFEELKMKMQGIDDDRANYKRYTEHRGQWALQRKGYYVDFGWSVEAEFDESILLWHIATDLLYHYTTDVDDKNNVKEDNEQKTSTPTDKYRDISKSISNYMMFLLIARPFMMPAGIGQIRFGDSSEEAKNFLQQPQRIDMQAAANKILKVSTEVDPAAIKGDRSKSLLFDGCKLAHDLQEKVSREVGGKKETDTKMLWDMIGRVWVEMMCYAASKCSGQYHAKQLSKGGELLTVVWYLMAHLGMGEQYRIEKGHARAKLIIPK